MAQYIVNVPDEGELLFSMLLEQMNFSAYPIESEKIEKLSPEHKKMLEEGLKDIEDGNVHTLEEFREIVAGWNTK